MPDVRTRKLVSRSSSSKRADSKTRVTTVPLKVAGDSPLSNKSIHKTTNSKPINVLPVSKPTKSNEKIKVRRSSGRSHSVSNKKPLKAVVSNEKTIKEEPVPLDNENEIKSLNITRSLTDKLEKDETKVIDEKKESSPEQSPVSIIQVDEDVIGGNKSEEIPVPVPQPEVHKIEKHVSPPRDIKMSVITCNGKQRSCKKYKSSKQTTLAESLTEQMDLLSSKARLKRSETLLRMIELAVEEHQNLFDLKPMDPYSNYMLQICQHEYCHVSCQTLDDSFSKDTQTEKPRSGPYSSWTQIPPAFEGGSSGHVRYAFSSGNYNVPMEGGAAQTASTATIPNDNSPNVLTLKDELTPSAICRLASSLGTVLSVLEEEEEGGEATAKYHRAYKSHVSFIPQEHQQSLTELECIRCDFSNYRLLTTHRLKSPNKVGNAVDTLAGDMVCVWKICGDSGQGCLEHTLKCPGLLPMSGRSMDSTDEVEEGIICVVSESGPMFNMVVGGLSEGSLVIWDLTSKAPPNQGRNKLFEDASLPSIFGYARCPDYLSSVAFSESCTTELSESISASPIMALKTLKRDSNPPKSFQFCSLSARGELAIWMATQTAPRDGFDAKGCANDYGLRPGSCVRLVQISTLKYEVPPSSKVGWCVVTSHPPNQLTRGEQDWVIPSPFTTCLEVCQTANRFFIGSLDGCIKQKMRNAHQYIFPGEFTLSSDAPTTAAVSSLSLNPFLPNLFIAGYANGHLAIFSTNYPQPLFKWQLGNSSDPCPNGIRRVFWSPHRPSVVFCLSTDGQVIAWSLLSDGTSNRLRPVAKVLISSLNDKREVMDFSVASGRNGCLVVCWRDGAEIHWLEEDLIVRKENELCAIESALDELC